VRGIDDAERIADKWDALADRVGAAPFLRPGWIAAWWRAFGRGRLEILTASRGGTLHAVLPLARGRLTTSSPTNWHTPRFGVLADGAAARTAVLDELFSQPSHLVSLGFLLDRDPDLDALRAAAERARRLVLVRTLERSRAVVVRGEWSSYERSLGGGLRRDVGRRRRRLDELGRVTLDITEHAERLDTPLAEAFALENSAWKAQRGTAIASRPETATFYTQVARWAAERGWLRLIFLRLDGRPVAFHFAIEHAGIYFPLKGGFDPEFGGYSPGQLIIRETLKRAFAIGLQRYEFLGGDADYKRRWATRANDRILIQAFTPTLPGLIYRATFVYGRPAAKRLLTTVRR
jgi:CelD/BcsL family acetyltransferase involved in cellulose biosynthesis